MILDDPPVSSRFASRDAVRSAAAQSYRQQIEARQQTLRNELASRNIPITGSVVTLMNAIFVTAPKDRVPELRALPGVKAVVPLRRYHLNLNRATQLVDAPAAWNALGGIPNAGSGIKIAILDTGIDQTNPAFQDPSLPMPPGYPMCSGADCAFTSNKVIVARSYVRQIAAGSAPNPAADSRPDDYSPRDRIGHGTAVASCAAGVTNTGHVTFTGMAPKAYLGNYKIYGSPEVNEASADDVIIRALEDALHDGMDIVSFSSGSPAFSGPLESGAICGNNPGVPCDLSAQAFENAARAGLVIVAAAGNDGQSANNYPALNSIESPGDAPSVIAVGATTNAHVFQEMVSVPGPGVPSNLQNITTRSGDAFVPRGAITAPLVDVTAIGNDGLACTALPPGSLVGVVALIERGVCNFSDKLANASDAGAIGVIFYMSDASPLIDPSNLSMFDTPAVMISNSDGLALKNLVQTSPDHAVTIDPAGVEQSTAAFNQLAGFSSFGPNIKDFGIKPDLVAVGTSMYMAGESYDPLGPLYGSDGYSLADGTSFSTPLVAGAAALVKQSHPAFNSAQIKSALVNTSTQDVTTDDTGNPVGIEAVGAGKLDAGAAVKANVTADPATIAFGVLTAGSLPKTQQLQITNGGSAAVNVTLTVAARTPAPGTQVALDKQSLSLAPGGTGTVSITLSGGVPTPGIYSGAITVQGANVPLRIPYLYLVGRGTAANMITLSGDGFDGTTGGGIPDGILAFKLVDTFGVPIANAPVTWTPRNGATLRQADSTTDANGIAAAEPVLGSQPGNYSFVAVAGGLRTTFSGFARVRPSISPNGIVNAANFDSASPVAPGSYISIFGSGLSDTTGYATTATLPLAIDLVNVSFDVPAEGLSLPGRLLYASPSQINLQVPWELQGHSSVQVKVTIDYTLGNVVTLSLSDYAPALFEAGQGVAAAVDLSGNPISASNPAHGGQTISIFANGLGPVTNQPASGDPAPLAPLAETKTKPTVTIGGQSANVLFSGLTPGYPGLYQMNVMVPSGLGAGAQSITVAIGGRTSKSSNISVQ